MEWGGVVGVVGIHAPQQGVGEGGGPLSRKREKGFRQSRG